MSKPDEKTTAFLERYVRQHYEVETFSIDDCIQKEENADSWYEALIDWSFAQNTGGRFTLYFKDLAGLYSVHYVDGSVPDEIYTLVPSLNPGRYAFNDPEDGHDLTSGEPLKILLNGQWIKGHIEHSGLPTPKYPDASGVYTITGVNGLHIGYYFIADNSGVCGLCTGMRVKKVR